MRCLKYSSKMAKKKVIISINNDKWKNLKTVSYIDRKKNDLLLAFYMNFLTVLYNFQVLNIRRLRFARAQQAVYEKKCINFVY